MLKFRRIIDYFRIDPSFREFYRLRIQSNRIFFLIGLETCKPKHQHDRIGNQIAFLALTLNRKKVNIYIIKQSAFTKNNQYHFHYQHLVKWVFYIHPVSHIVNFCNSSLAQQHRIWHNYVDKFSVHSCPPRFQYDPKILKLF